MGYKILEHPAEGADGGRDILVERSFRDDLGERRERVVVQCKHSATSSRSFGEHDIGQWQNPLARFGAKTYLLAVSTRVTETLNRVFIEYSGQQGHDKQAVVWDGDKLKTLLSRFPELIARYFSRLQLTRSVDFSKGWGVVFSIKSSGDVLRALRPLLDLRKRQAEDAGGIYREFQYQPGEKCHRFLSRHGVGPGHPNLTLVPWFLMIVGDGEDIPFSFQTTLSIQYAVGRVVFDQLDDYSRYAKSITKAERARQKRMQITFFNPKHDYATERTLAGLILPLERQIKLKHLQVEIKMLTGAGCTRKRLSALLGGSSDFVFGSAHGLGFPLGDSRQKEQSGSLVTSEWSGVGNLLRSHYLAAEDISPSSRFRGKIVFFFGCYSAGIREVDEYSSLLSIVEQKIAQTEFVAAIPKKLLSTGMALAVIGHVGRSWTSAFSWGGEDLEPTTFIQIASDILSGEAVGIAIQASSKRCAELAVPLNDHYESHLRGRVKNAAEMADFEDMRRAMISSRDFIVIGDPAVRLKL